ncbi:MAG TPA: rhomboid family intramembrane serine protease, partial [Roseiflexaceae bacterium]|nr:rhomboid family intramembrane serine protease [Roseiflexaceae bacterium]
PDAGGAEQQARPVRVGLPPGARVPWAARVLLGLNIAIFVVPWLLSQALGLPLDELVLALGAKDNRAIFQGGEYYRFLTAMFLHGGPTHILFNAWALYALGFEAERIYGTARFLAVYFLAGLAGGAASYALNPFPSVGASGAIFGLIGALAAFYYTARGVLGGIARQQLGSLLFVILINIGLGLASPNIDNNAHIGGLLAGGLAGWLLAPRFALVPYAYPPLVERRSLPLAWPGVLALLAAVAGLVVTIVPPLR